MPLLAWGEAGAPLVPRSLRLRWSNEKLPAWVCDDLGMLSGSTISSLDSGPLPPEPKRAARVQAYLAQLIDGRRSEIDGVESIGLPLPPSIEVAELPLKSRTRFAISKHPVFRRTSELPYLTFGQLLGIPGMGSHSVLDLTCTIEAAMQKAADADAPNTRQDDSAAMSELLLEALSQPWAAMVSGSDRRFQNWLPAGSPPVAEQIDILTASPESRESDFSALAGTLKALRPELERVTSLRLEVGLAEYVAVTAGVRDKRLAALLARLQLTGQPAQITLEEAGTRAGVTRERMRQIQARFSDRQPKHQVYLPALDRALGWLSENAPIAATEAAQALAEDSISERPFHPASILAAARLLGHATGVSIESIRDIPTVVGSPSGPHVRFIVREAQRQLSGSGVSNVLEVAAAVRMNHEQDHDEVLVREVLQTYASFEFLHGDWFWDPNRQSDPLRMIARRVLSLVSEIDVERLREGIRRQFRFRESLARRMGRPLLVPPRAVLAAYLAAHPEFVLQQDSTVRSVRPLDYRSELGPIERTVVEVIRSSPSSVLDRASVLQRTTALGVNANSASIALTYSSTIEHLGTDLWTIRGAIVDPVVVESVRRSKALRVRERRVLDYGWSNDGHLWVAARIPESIEAFVFGVPSPVSRYLAGRDFDASDMDGNPSGRIRVYDYGAATGFVPFLRRAGADEGDLLLMRFDLVASTAVLSVIGNDDLDTLSPEED